MPKKVDHDVYRAELAHRAAPLFSEHGYSGLGMRAVAEALGVSKSALYHYFPTKRDLFLACTAAVTELSEPTELVGPVPEQLLGLAAELRPGFGAEMALLFDYLRGMDAETVAADPAMRLALERFEQWVARVAGAEHARAALAFITGALLLEHFSGGRWPVDEVRRGLDALLDPRRADPSAGPDIGAR
ncbi:MAG: TetR/AcrR family transcriptional regulator [Deltaproteobacteria bacterium]|nr:TetR/AcrR family transcriptional regulator [Deltaproteobacteria bacterium]